MNIEFITKYWYVIFILGVLYFLFFFIIKKDKRKSEMENLAKELSFDFKSYVFGSALSSRLNFLKKYQVGSPVNIIEGNKNGKYFLIFDIFFDFDQSKKTIYGTFLNGKYYKLLSAESIRGAILNNNFSDFELLGKEDEIFLLKTWEIAVLNVYFNLNKESKTDLEVVKMVLQNLRSINADTIWRRLKESTYMNNVNYSAAELIEKTIGKIAKKNFQISNEVISEIINEYINLFK